MTSSISEGPPATVFFDEKTKKKMKEKASKSIDEIIAKSVKPVLHNGADKCLTTAVPCVGLMVANTSLAHSPCILASCVSACPSVCAKPVTKLSKKFAHKGIDLSVDSSTKSSKKSINYSIEKHPNKTATFCLKFIPEES